MACCKCCCGNVDCTEGQEGKCCCGGIYGECCQEGEYCCDGVCEPAPCGCTGACEWQPVWANDDTWSGVWELLSGCPDPVECNCAEPDEVYVGTVEQGLTFFTPCQECLSDAGCDGGYCCDGVCQPGECQDPCDDATDCPYYGLSCGEIFPNVPYNCCDGLCEPHACYPSAQITLNFRKKIGCTAVGLSGVAEEEEFDVVMSGASIGTCGETTLAGISAPCTTTWTLGVGCVVTNVAFSAGGNAVCEECYEFLGSSSCRLDCNGDCA